MVRQEIIKLTSSLVSSFYKFLVVVLDCGLYFNCYVNFFLMVRTFLCPFTLGITRVLSKLTLPRSLLCLLF